MTRIVSVLFAIMMAMAPAVASADTDALDARARRAFNAGDWPSAYALYTLVADATPTDANACARAMVAASLTPDSLQATVLLERSLAAGVALDSILTPARREFLAAHRADAYESLLQRIARSMPYLKRPIDSRLLRFYLFRRDADGIIRLATRLLAARPESPEYLCALAGGYVLTSQFDLAAEAWEQAIAADPGCFDALTGLGNLYAPTDAARALPYLRRAAALRPTPYLLDKIRVLSSKTVPEK